MFYTSLLSNYGLNYIKINKILPKINKSEIVSIFIRINSEKICQGKRVIDLLYAFFLVLHVQLIQTLIFLRILLDLPFIVEPVVEYISVNYH